MFFRQRYVAVIGVGFLGNRFDFGRVYMSVKLEAGQWYRVRGGSIVRCVERSMKHVKGFICECRSNPFYIHESGSHFYGNSNWDVIEHLPDCTGFDWEPPKPVVVPKGWEVVTEGVCKEGDLYLFDNGQTGEIKIRVGEEITEAKDARGAVAIVRKKPPKYRPFANAEEFKPFRDKWWKYSDGGEVVWPPACYSDEGYGDTDWEYCFVNQVFEDGTPFGIRVDE